MQPLLETHSIEDRANQIVQEYEDFAYIVSHDLNAPLRHVREFTRLLVGNRKGHLTEEEQQYVEFLELSLTKLDDMQRALLTFSRLNTRAGEPVNIDLNETLSKTLKDLATPIQKYQPVIEYKDLPIIVAEPKQIELLFFHLLDNAIKFHDETSPERQILVTAMDQGDTWLFEIKDNGIGIDQKYHEDVFRLFRRLEPEKYPGIGAGLTIAHKIIQRHGGEMLIESVPNQGTSVFFSIEKPQL